jgi:hypothetical protein
VVQAALRPVCRQGEVPQQQLCLSIIIIAYKPCLSALAPRLTLWGGGRYHDDSLCLSAELVVSRMAKSGFWCLNMRRW